MHREAALRRAQRSKGRGEKQTERREKQTDREGRERTETRKQTGRESEANVGDPPACSAGAGLPVRERETKSQVWVVERESPGDLGSFNFCFSIPS